MNDKFIKVTQDIYLR